MGKDNSAGEGKTETHQMSLIKSSLIFIFNNLYVSAPAHTTSDCVSFVNKFPAHFVVLMDK